MNYFRKVRIVTVVAGALGLSGCFKASQSINPPQLISASETDVAVQLFMQATLMVARYYNYPTLSYVSLSERAQLAGVSTVPFMPLVTVRATPPLDWSRVGEGSLSASDFQRFINDNGLYKQMMKYYIKTGLKASQLICRNHLLNLDERSRFLKFLQDELGVVYALSDAILAAVDANGTLIKAFSIGKTALTNGLDVYGKYRFGIDAEAALVVVETTQEKYAAYFMQKVDKPVFLASADDVTGYDPGVPFSFSEALHAVNVIEYQCTQSGINYLLNRAVTNTPTNLQIDKVTGIPVFDSTRRNTQTTDDVPPANPPGGQGRSPAGSPKPAAGQVTPLAGSTR